MVQDPDPDPLAVVAEMDAEKHEAANMFCVLRHSEPEEKAGSCVCFYVRNGYVAKNEIWISSGSFLEEADYQGWVLVEEESCQAAKDPDKAMLHDGGYIRKNR